MNDYKRLVSYIYSYPGGVREKNVGFAKAEVRNGQFKLFVSLKGVYTDTPESFGVYLMFDKDDVIEGRYTLFPIGSLIINNGVGKYNDLLNPENINSSGYNFSDINGIAVARKDDRYYMMFSLWGDGRVEADSVNFVEPGYKKSVQGGLYSLKKVSAKAEPSEKIFMAASIEEAPVLAEALEAEAKVSALPEVKVSASHKEFEVKEAAECVKAVAAEEDTTFEGFDKIFENADYINVFDDDYYYDCIEVSPKQLCQLPFDDEIIVNNSFLMHGYYNFKHILFGRVRENERHTRYFIGVPGMYCNRERFMASMFSFNNFKKSCRGDYSNPYFGYWYQEI